MLEMIQALWAVVKVLGVLGLIISAIVIYVSIKEGLIQTAIGFGSIFFLIILFGWHEFLGEQFMVTFMLAIVVGIAIAFFIWI